jgi:hypothetical protein
LVADDIKNPDSGIIRKRTRKIMVKRILYPGMIKSRLIRRYK